MSELKERWTLWRQERSVALDNEQQFKTSIPDMMQDVINEKGQPFVARTLERIKTKRNLIEGWKDAIVFDQEQQQLGDMHLSTLKARRRNYDNQITHTLREIEDDLRNLGFTVEKNS